MHNQEIYDLEQDLEKIYMSSGLGQGGVTLQKQAWTSLDTSGQVWTSLDNPEIYDLEHELEKMCMC